MIYHILFTHSSACGRVCCFHLLAIMGFSRSSDGKESACNAEDPSLIPGSGRSPGKGHGNPFQYSLPGDFYGQSGRLQLMGLHRVRHDWATNTLVLMCDAAMNTSIQISSQVLTLNLLGIYLEVELLDHRWSQRLVFWGSAIILSSVAAPFYVFTNNTQVFQFLCILDNSCFLFLFS